MPAMSLSEDETGVELIIIIIIIIIGKPFGYLNWLDLTL